MKECPNCRQRFKRAGYLELHVRKGICQTKSCPGCGKEFTRNTNYKNHVEHNLCGLCGPYQRCEEDEYDTEDDSNESEDGIDNDNDNSDNESNGNDNENSDYESGDNENSDSRSDDMSGNISVNENNSDRGVNRTEDGKDNSKDNSKSEGMYSGPLIPASSLVQSVSPPLVVPPVSPEGGNFSGIDFVMDQANPNLRNRLANMTGFDSTKESLAAWKKRKFFPKKKLVERKGREASKEETVRTIEALSASPLRFKGTEDEHSSLFSTSIDIQTIIQNLVKEVREVKDQIKDQVAVEIEKSLVPYETHLATDKKEGKSEEKDGNDAKIDIVCLAKGDYIKKLIQLHDGDEEKAMNYIKNVGIASDFLEGDFRMIKKIYFDGKKKSQFPIRIKDYKRNKLEYLEENGEWILDIRGEIVGKRLCENIVSTLLIANTQFNEVIIQEEDEDRKELLLDLFQINKTQAHIMKLLERKTQGKLCRRVAEFINYCTEVQAETGSLDNVKKAYE